MAQPVPGFMIVGTTDRKKARKIAWGLRIEGEVLASFFCSFTLTESLVQAITGINVAQPRSHSARGASHVMKLVLWRQTFIFFLQKPTLRHITWGIKDFCCGKESDGTDHCSGNNPTYDNKSYVTNSLKRFQVCDKKTNKQKSKLLGQRIFFSVFETLLKLMYFLCDLVQPNLNWRMDLQL